MDFKVLSFAIGACCMLGSIFFHAKEKDSWSIFFLILSAFLFFVSAATWYPFLNVWDERFHALVAKNLMKHPGMPTLYDDPVMLIAYDNWDRYHIWLHKQPLFLWQIALSFKLFGLNEFALRLPGILISTVVVFAIYRSGKILGNKNTGFYAAFLFTTSLYVLELISGRQEVDQNDVAFMGYTSLSIWSWIEYQYSGKKIWLAGIGLFSGFAVLCKWLAGLLVYAVWGMYMGMDLKTTIRSKSYLKCIIAFLITLLVFLPWQFLIFYRYPAEAKAMMELNASHLTEAVDGRGGDFFYHFAFMGWLFGSLVPWLLIPSFFLVYKKSGNKKMALALSASIVFVYLFFSLTQTKMPSFPMVAVLPVYISLAFGLDFIVELIRTVISSSFFRIAIVFLLLTGIFYFRLDYKTLHDKHGFLNKEPGYASALPRNKKVFQSLHLPANTVICNVPGRHYVEAMFYTGLPAYNIIPSESQYQYLCNKHRIVAIFQPQEGELPEYLRKDRNLIVLKEKIEEFE